MKPLRDYRFSREPAVWVTFLQAAITIAVSWGLSLNESQIFGLFAGMTAFSGMLIRSNVRPVSTSISIAEKKPPE